MTKNQTVERLLRLLITLLGAGLGAGVDAGGALGLTPRARDWPGSSCANAIWIAKAAPAAASKA